MSAIGSMPATVLAVTRFRRHITNTPKPSGGDHDDERQPVGHPPSLLSRCLEGIPTRSRSKYPSHWHRYNQPTGVDLADFSSIYAAIEDLSTALGELEPESSDEVVAVTRHQKIANHTRSLLNQADQDLFTPAQVESVRQAVLELTGVIRASHDTLRDKLGAADPRATALLDQLGGLAAVARTPADIESLSESIQTFSDRAGQVLGELESEVQRQNAVLQENTEAWEALRARLEEIRGESVTV